MLPGVRNCTSLSHNSREPNRWTKRSGRSSRKTFSTISEIFRTPLLREAEGKSGAFGDEKLANNLLFYLATPPSQFAEVVHHLHNAGLLQRDNGGFWQRLVVEKPFGHDLASAVQLNEELTRFAHEKQVYRIDHYLGKETVQNILMFRFSNAIFEELWTRRTIDHVQITVS
jgi:glucose-6-phosphate 1-dehydrogenase